MTPSCLRQSMPGEGRRRSTWGIYGAGASLHGGEWGKQHLPSKHRQQQAESLIKSMQTCRMRPWGSRCSLPPACLGAPQGARQPWWGVSAPELESTRIGAARPPAPQCSALSLHAAVPLSLSQRICHRRHVAQLGLVTAGDARRQLGRREGNGNGLCLGQERPFWDPKQAGWEVLPPARGVSM